MDAGLGYRVIFFPDGAQKMYFVFKMDGSHQAQHSLVVDYMFLDGYQREKINHLGWLNMSTIPISFGFSIIFVPIFLTY